MGDYYTRTGEPFSLAAWASTFGAEDNHVADDTVLVPIRVSTVYLGLDHSFGSGPPLIFETMIFGASTMGWADRYSTEAEALAGHARICAAVREGRKP
jgi:hypothetical protein